MAAQSASMKQLEPLTLFHLRDALRVSTSNSEHCVLVLQQQYISRDTYFSVLQ